VAPVTFTFDLEDSRPSPALPARFPAVTERVLAFLEARGARGTFFVVGELAAQHPELMAAIARAGHEVGLHGWRHVPLDKLSPEQLAEDLRRGKAAIEDAAGAPARGFRAPIFSLCRRTLWAVDALVEAGFAYSSSVLPAANPLYGYPEAPARPFRWEAGLVELPCAVAGRGRAAIPFLGGVYLRYLPMRLVLALARRIAPGALPWIYCHPYDFDPDEPFVVMPETNWLTSRILHTRRRHTFDRVGTLLDRLGAALPLAEVASSVRA
jgi:peptidoglycan-N-acetylglucosamine deacetylase